jgi:hypothetical protein
VRRPFLGSILGLPAMTETIHSRAEGMVAGAPVLGRRLGRAQHHRVVATVTVRRRPRQPIAENSINCPFAPRIGLAERALHGPAPRASGASGQRQRPRGAARGTRSKIERESGHKRRRVSRSLLQLVFSLRQDSAATKNKICTQCDRRSFRLPFSTLSLPCRDRRPLVVVEL